MVLALGAALAANVPGLVEVEWFGWHVAFHPVWLVAALALFWCVTHIARRAWNWLRWKSGLFGPARTLRRQRAALGNASAALATLVFGQEERAATLAGDALKSDPTNVMARAVAAMTGDEARIEQLDQDRATKPLAALARLRTSPGVSAAEQATLVAPASPVAWRAVVEESARAGDFAGALTALPKWRALDDEAERLGSWIEAALRTGAADAELDEEPARAELARALKAEPRFAPAATRLALFAEEAPDVSAAERAAESVWSVQPTPQLGRAYAELYPLETDSDRLARLQRLAEQNPEHPDSLLLVGEAALMAGDPSLALDSVAPLLETPPVRLRAAAIALEAYRRLGMEPAMGAAWLDAAATGAPGLRWQCTNCRTQTVDWVLECPNCRHVGLMLPETAI